VSETWKRVVLYAGGVMNNMILMSAAVLSTLLASRVVVEVIGRPGVLMIAAWMLLPALAIAVVTLPKPTSAGEGRPHRGEIRRTGAWGIGTASVVAPMAILFAVAPDEGEAWGFLWFGSTVGYVTFLGLAIVASGSDTMRAAMMAWGVVLAVLPGFVLGALTTTAASWLTTTYPYAAGVIGPPCGGFAVSAVLLFHLQIAGESFSEALREQFEEVPPRLVLLSGTWLLVAGVAMYGPVMVHWLLQASPTTYVLPAAVAALAIVVLSMSLAGGRGGVCADAMQRGTMAPD